MPITIYIWLLIVAVCGTAAICLMAGHAIGYRKAEKLWKYRIMREYAKRDINMTRKLYDEMKE